MKKKEILATFVVALIGSTAIGGGIALQRSLEGKKEEAKCDELLREIRELLLKTKMQDEGRISQINHR